MSFSSAEEEHIKRDKLTGKIITRKHVGSEAMITEGEDIKKNKMNPI
jgi:hypothetical protein